MTYCSFTINYRDIDYYCPRTKRTSRQSQPSKFPKTFHIVSRNSPLSRLSDLPLRRFSLSPLPSLSFDSSFVLFCLSRRRIVSTGRWYHSPRVFSDNVHATAVCETWHALRTRDNNYWQMRPTNAAFVSLARQSRRLVLLMKTLCAWRESQW